VSGAFDNEMGRAQPIEPPPPAALAALRNPDAELYLLTELVADNRLIDNTADHLRPADFGVVIHARIFALMLKEAARMDALVGRILDLGRPPTLDLKPLKVSELLHELAVEARALAAAAGDTVRVEERYDPALPTLSADELRLHEALLNLVKNAVEATSQQGGTVRLEARWRPSGGAPRPRARPGRWCRSA